MAAGSRIDEWEKKDPEQWNAKDKIRYLLDHWSDIWEPSIPSSLSDETARGNSSSSRPPGLLPPMSRHPSVRELARALNILATAEPVLARHLKAYRCNAQWRTVDCWFPVKTSSGKLDLVPGRKRERIVPKWHYPPHVAAAEDLLVKFFHGEVFVPQDLWKSLTEPISSV